MRLTNNNKLISDNRDLVSLGWQMKFAATMFENIIALSNLHFHAFNHSFDTTILSYEKKKKKYYKIISYRLKEIDFSSYKHDNSFLSSAHRSEEKAYTVYRVHRY